MADIVALAPAPGLPDIALLPGIVATAPLLADALDVLAAFGSSPWGIYQNGVPVVVADTVLDLGYDKAFTISDYPIEDGSFASYNKVETPFTGRVRFAAGGSPDVRQALIASVEGIVGDLNLYDVVTPDQVYVNANVLREEYRRTYTDGGASLVAIDVSVQEVRILAAATTGQSTTDPSSGGQTNGGTVQGQDPGTTQTPVTTPPPTLGDGVGGLPVPSPPGSGGIGSA